MRLCVDCKHHVFYSWIPFYRELAHVCNYSWAEKQVNYVTGEILKLTYDCAGMNPHGQCSHFEHKVNWFKRFLKWLGIK